MKGGLALYLSAFMRARAEGLTPAGDVLLAALSDEEAGGDFGARYLVESHAGLFEGVRYAVGEIGGFSLLIGRKTFYPIQVAEKQICWMKATVRGPGGHGSLPMRGGAMAKLAKLIERLEENRLPVHVTPIMRQMMETVAQNQPFPTSTILRQLLNPPLSGVVLKLLGDRGRMFEALLRNTVNPTIVRGGEKVNVIPNEVVLELDGRLLPGYGPDDMVTELRRVMGDEVELEVVRHDPGPGEPDMGMFDLLAGILVEADPGGVPVPLLLPGTSDARFFSRLGIQTYGFTPMKLPSEIGFMESVHGADERIPVKAVEFGAGAVYELLRRYRG